MFRVVSLSDRSAPDATATQMTITDSGATLDVPAAYAGDGFFFPVRVFSAGEVAQFRDW